MMADRYCGTPYVGKPADLAARIHQHRGGDGSDFCQRYGLGRLVWAEPSDIIEAGIQHEKRVRKWRREWKLALIEKASPDWSDLFDKLV